MQLVNDQYKIIREDSHDSFGTTYVVEDISQGNLAKYMKVIPLENNTRNFIEYLKYSFYDHSQHEYKNLMRFYFFNKIRAIDYKPVSTNQYYFTYEYFEGMSIDKYCKGKSPEQLLSFVADLCSAAKYMHLRGFLLRCLDVDDLQVIEKDNDCYLKLVSFPYPENANSRIVINNENPCFKAPETNNGDGYSRLSDIYLIGAIIYNIFSGFIHIDKIRDTVDPIGYIKNNALEDKRLMDIVEKCTAFSTAERFQSVDELFEKFNSSFPKGYKLFEKEKVQTMPGFRLKPVARYHIIDNLISNAKEHFFVGREKQAYLVMGSEGSGKDNFLDTFLYRASQEGFLSTNIILTESENLPMRTFELIIKNISQYLENELVDRYMGDIDKLKLSKEYSKEVIVQRFSNFIAEVSQKYHFVIVIDNFQWIDEASMEFIEELLSPQNKPKIYFVFATDKEVYSESNEVKEFCQKLRRANLLDIITLANFDFTDTAEFVRLILGMDKPPYDFARIVYEQTKGKPEYIYNTIYMLFTNNIIYVDDMGHWMFDKVDKDSLRLNYTDDIDLWSNVYRLSSDYQEILKAVSIFSGPVPVFILEDFFSLDKKDLVKQLNYLCYINILARGPKDWESSYSFLSGNLKKLVYESIPEADRVVYHDKAVHTLMNKFHNDGRGNDDELINQMIKAGMMLEAKKYISETVEYMLENNSLHQAIQLLEHASLFISMGGYEEEMIMIASKLGELYDYTGDYAKALAQHDIVEGLAKASDNNRLLIDVYIKKYIFLYKSENSKEALKYLALAKNLLKTVDYKSGMYKLIISINRMMFHKRKFTSYTKLLEKILRDINKEEHRQSYARLLGLYGRFEAYKGKQIEGIANLLESIAILEDMGIYRKLLFPLNSLGSIYYNFYNDKYKAKEYYEKCLSISQRFGDSYYIGISYNNLAEICRMEDKPWEALQYYQSSLKNAKLINDKYGELLTSLNIVETNFEIEDYNKSLAIYIESKEEFLSSKYSGDLMDFYYQCTSEFCYAMGEYEKAAEYAQKSVEMCIS
ncbi:MAG: tetratricopeptide repeat protein, partial [Pseudomonadota bacterium]